MKARKRNLRQGSVYIAVTGVAMMVALIGFTSMHLSRLELRMSTSQQDDSYARVLAQSSVEMAIAQIHALGDPAWRSSFTSGTENTIVPNFNFKPLYFKYIDTTDGNLGNNNTDPVKIQGIGRCGNSTFVYSVDYAPSVTSAQQVSPPILQSYVGTATNMQHVNDSNFLGQHFIPSLPAGTLSWSITHIDVYLENHGNLGATMTFNFFSSDSNGKPGTLIETLAVPESTFPPESSPDYHSFNLSSATGLTPGQGYCFTMEQTGEGNCAIVHYQPGVSQTDTHLLRNQGSWVALASETLKFRINGSYTTQTASGEFTITPGTWKRVTAP